MNRTAPWSKRRFFLHSATKALERLAYFVALLLAVAVNVPVSAVALRKSVVVKLFQRNGILFRPHLPRSVFLDFFVGEVILSALASVWARSP